MGGDSTRFEASRELVLILFRPNGWAPTSAGGAFIPRETAQGVVGGKGGEGKALPCFMLRIRIPNGILNSSQLRTIAELTERHARGIADLTVRQNIQLHWVTIEALPEILEALWQCGLNSMGACGDVTRNVTGCPVAGVDADEICDASPLALAATQMLAGNPDFYNLPRKFKISITGCRVWCAYPEINDVGLTAVTRTLNGKAESWFLVTCGRRTLGRTSSRSPSERIRSLEPGRAGHQRHR